MNPMRPNSEEPSILRSSPEQDSKNAEKISRIAFNSISSEHDQSATRAMLSRDKVSPTVSDATSRSASSQLSRRTPEEVREHWVEQHIQTIRAMQYDSPIVLSLPNEMTENCSEDEIALLCERIEHVLTQTLPECRVIGCLNHHKQIVVTAENCHERQLRISVSDAEQWARANISGWLNTHQLRIHEQAYCELACVQELPLPLSSYGCSRYEEVRLCDAMRDTLREYFRDSFPNVEVNMRVDASNNIVFAIQRGEPVHGSVQENLSISKYLAQALELRIPLNPISPFMLRINVPLGCSEEYIQELCQQLQKELRLKTARSDSNPDLIVRPSIDNDGKSSYKDGRLGITVYKDANAQRIEQSLKLLQQIHGKPMQEEIIIVTQMINTLRDLDMNTLSREKLELLHQKLTQPWFRGELQEVDSYDSNLAVRQSVAVILQRIDSALSQLK